MAEAGRSAARALRDAAALASLLLLIVLAGSGWGLMAAYVPSEQEAFDSVVYLRRAGGALGFLRSLHDRAAAALVVAGAVYLAASVLVGGLARRRRSWWASLALFLLVLGASFTGFLLPMDQDAWWGNTVRLGIVESVAGIGPALATLLRGGAAFDASTLPRYYALHVSLLPIALLALVFACAGELAAAARAVARPRWLAGFGLALLAGVCLWAGFAPALLEPRANPADTAYVPRPEWYFLWLFQLGKYVEPVPWVQSFLVPVAIGVSLLSLPLLREPAPRARGLAVALAGVAWLSLTGLALWQDRALPERPSHEQALALRAAENYRLECQSCHGESGRGDGPQSRAFGLDSRDFTDPAFWQRTSGPEQLAAIRDGKGADMPAFGKKLPEEDIEALVDYLAARFRPGQ